MKIYLLNQQDNLKKHLDRLRKLEVMAYDLSHLKEKISTIEINTAKTFDQLDLDFLFKYQIFPGNIMTFSNQWTEENRKMQIGDTIAQQVFIPPSKTFSQKIIFGVRINEIFDLKDKKGFSYETLEGHVERGISTFTIEQQADKLIFKIQTYSGPGNFLTRMLGPFFSVPYQTFCTRAALKNVKRQLENQG